MQPKIKDSDVFSSDIMVKPPFRPKTDSEKVVTKKRDYLSLVVTAVTLFAVLVIVLLALLFSINSGHDADAHVSSSELRDNANNTDVNILKEEVKSLRETGWKLLSALKTTDVEGMKHCTLLLLYPF